ncbi:hypothetical protein ABAC460_15950 [Asticcacaulis sp. AC460]|uniref:hypothetical protein n=1 Tax=Asticcacaulis sp. AC460 TaxID=1282360 RepID=UPI0003C3C432|nr:hypothetical protein [Asticcacaulis sp. AC460]ESQ88152.1 hypothetical protein ABAC460_15950 [Asticcacaulis sp. AC460]
MKFYACTLAGLAAALLAQSAMAAPLMITPENRLSCAANYGILAARPDSPRARAAAAARAALIEGFRENYPGLVGADATAARDADLADQRAGECDRLYRYSVAETSAHPFNAPLNPPRQPSPPPVQVPPSNTQSGVGFLATRCDGQKQTFDPGLPRDELVAQARARGCTTQDIDNLLATRDMLF